MRTFRALSKDWPDLDLFMQELPAIVESKRRRHDLSLRIELRECGRGIKVYYLAMRVHQRLTRIAPEIRLEVIGTDPDVALIRMASNGVFLWEDLESLPPSDLTDYWSRGKGEIVAYGRARRAVRDLVRFQQVDVNVTRPSLGCDVRFIRTTRFNPIRVVCVDDSVTTQNHFKRMLNRDEGFEMIGLAQNGADAVDLIRDAQPDLVLLDLHMPRMDGVEYLQHYLDAHHAPVVVIASYFPEDAALVFSAIQAGATDYVLRPTLSTGVRGGAEIREKLRSIVALTRERGRSKVSAKGSVNGVARVLVTTVPERKVSVVLGGLSDRHAIYALLGEGIGAQPPQVVLIDGAGPFLSLVVKEAQSTVSRHCVVGSAIKGKLAPDSIIFVADSEELTRLITEHQADRQCFMVFKGGRVLASDDSNSTRTHQIVCDDDASAGQLYHRQMQFLSADQ